MFTQNCRSKLYTTINHKNSANNYMYTMMTNSNDKIDVFCATLHFLKL